MTMSASKRGNDVFFHLKCEGVEGGGNGFHGDLNPKRSKGDRGKVPISVRERKDKIGEKVATLQQLVSPYGKTDTASVLQEATGYIKFLQEQLKVLCAPYLQNPLVANSDRYSLRSRGLCLMPAAYSLQLAGSNGADIWAPINTRRP